MCKDSSPFTDVHTPDSSDDLSGRTVPPLSFNFQSSANDSDVETNVVRQFLSIVMIELSIVRLSLAVASSNAHQIGTRQLSLFVYDREQLQLPSLNTHLA